MHHNDHRFAENRYYVLWGFDQRGGAKVNRSVSLKINSGDSRVSKFKEIVNAEGFDKKLLVAVEDNQCAEARELRRDLLPLVQITGNNVKWTAIERKRTLGHLYPMYHFFSLPFIFWTFSPLMRD